MKWKQTADPSIWFHPLIAKIIFIIIVLLVLQRGPRSEWIFSTLKKGKHKYFADKCETTMHVHRSCDPFDQYSKACSQLHSISLNSLFSVCVIGISHPRFHTKKSKLWIKNNETSFSRHWKPISLNLCISTNKNECLYFD